MTASGADALHHAEILMEIGRYADAEPLLRPALAEDPEDPEDPGLLHARQRVGAAPRR